MFLLSCFDSPINARDYSATINFILYLNAHFKYIRGKLIMTGTFADLYIGFYINYIPC